MHPMNPKAGGGRGGVAKGKNYFAFSHYLKIVSQDFNRCSVVK